MFAILSRICSGMVPMALWFAARRANRRRSPMRRNCNCFDWSKRKQEVAAPGWQKDGSVATASWLQSHPAGKEPLAIWGCWDGPAEGAASALREAGRTDVKVYGDFAEPAGLDALKKGLFTATYWFDNGASGRKTVDLIRADSTKKVIVPAYINAPAVEVDQSNINQFLKKYPQALKG